MLEGVYTCKIEKALYKSESFDFEVVGGNTVNISKNLHELYIYGNIYIKSITESDIYIDNEKVGSQTYNGRLIEGLHIVKIQAENYKTFTKEILIVANKNYTIEEELIHKTGVISVQSEPMGASIFIDGDFKGTTPKFVRDVWAGEREISIEKEGFATHKEMIYVESDRTKEYIYKLESARKFTLTTTHSGADVYLNNVLIGKTPLSFELDQSNHNKIKITKEGYHVIYDELPNDSRLKEKNYNLEKHSLAYNADNKSSSATGNANKPKYRKIREDKKTDFGWSISGLSARPGGINSSIYGNFGNFHQYGVFLDGGYQFNNYSNSHIDGMVNFPRFSIGASFNLWLWNFAVLEAFAGFGREYATGLNWENYDIWDMPPDDVHTRYIKLGLRAGFRISPHAELFGSYVINNTDGPAYDVFGNQVEIRGTRYSYHTLFPDRSSQSWEIGIRFVVY
ncbi:MAG: hypothetical protein C0596_01150 [Marinilabiliales bacterium]|nr:MAG: hypothetical protein C0596_01150 [Marinilabiliales bacterium]